MKSLLNASLLTHNSMLNIFKEYPATIIKLGGSLFDLPDLGTRLEDFLEHHHFPNPIFIPGGGPFADAVRELDHLHHLGDAASHEIGTHTLSLSSRFVASLSVRFVLTALPEEFDRCWTRQSIPIFDAAAMTLNHSPLPSSWDVTSDSIAAWICSLHPKSQLVLVKSVDLPKGLSYRDATQAGLVDQYFPNIAGNLTHISWCNLRSESPTLSCW